MVMMSVMMSRAERNVLSGKSQTVKLVTHELNVSNSKICARVPKGTRSISNKRESYTDRVCRKILLFSTPWHSPCIHVTDKLHSSPLTVSPLMSYAITIMSTYNLTGEIYIKIQRKQGLDHINSGSWACDHDL